MFFFVLFIRFGYVLLRFYKIQIFLLLLLMMLFGQEERIQKQHGMYNKWFWSQIIFNFFTFCSRRM